MNTRRTDARRLLGALACLVVVVVVLGVAAPGPAAAKVTRIKASSVHGRHATFRVGGIPARRVRSARVKAHRRTKKVAAKTVRKSIITKQAVSVTLPAPAPAPDVTLIIDTGPPLTPSAPPTFAGTSDPAPDPAPAAPTTVPAPPAGTPASAPVPALTRGCGTVPALFGANAWPDGCWRPYADTSPFNRALGSAPPVLADSAAMVAKLTSFGSPQSVLGGTADTPDDWSHPVYWGQATDPLFTIHCVEAWGRCPVEGMTIRIPDAARAAAGGDGHMTVVDQASGWEYDFWQVRSKPTGGGRISISWGGRTRIDGDGLGSDATAARFGGLAGIIRASELARGRIDHALFLVFRCDSGTYVYPAMKSGKSCADAGLPTANQFPMGTRFQLAMSDAQIAALNVPAWKKTILTAMAHYGMYFGDTGGSSWGVQAESSSSYTSFGVADPLMTFARSAGVPISGGTAIYNLRDGVDWPRYLRAIDPCAARGTC